MLAGIPGVKGYAQTPDAQRQALQAIADTADRICNTVKLEGSSESQKVKGEVNAQLSGLSKALASLGFGAQAQRDTEKYAGLLRPDLPAALNANSDCKLRVFEKLSDIMLGNGSKELAKNTGGPWPTNTGAYEVDDVHSSLNNLPDNASEGAVAHIIQVFFSRPAFDHTGEADNNNNALFIFCRAQIILEKYFSKFSSTTVRKNISQATQNLIYLQDQFGKRYGAVFNRSDLCRNHSQTLREYVQNLPSHNDSYLWDPSERSLANRTLDALHQNLSAAGL